MDASRRSLLAAAPALVASRAAASLPDRWGTVTRRLRAAYPAGGPGACAVAARGERLVYAHAFGLADLEHRVALGIDAPMRIASLTKPFTAVAILRLVQDGLLTLDDVVGQGWPQCPATWRPLTVRSLLSHTSGITGDVGPLFAHATLDLTPDQLLGLYADAPLLWPPGQTWRYSNVNYWILGKLIEIKSGATYADYVSRHVLAPGMVRTRYGSNSDIIADRARGYEADGKGGWVNARYFSASIGYAAGGFLSTPREMARWYAALSRGAIVSADLLAQALTPVETRDGKPARYGLGWRLSDMGGARVAHHGGSTIGFLSYLYWVPARGLTAGVFRNASDDRGEPSGDARALLDALMT